MILDLGFSILKGLLLSGTVYYLGIYLDNTISATYKQELLKEDSALVEEGYHTTKINLLYISPVVYGIVDQTILKSEFSFSILHFLGLLLVQNIGYFWIHREMHQNNRWRWMHKFHHRFNKITLPSTGNAVSPYEFCIAYITPIVSAGIIFRPTEITFSSAIAVISLLNICIHIPNLKHTPWMPGFISPNYHSIHHLKNEKHYAAPLLDIDSFTDRVQSWVFLSDSDSSEKEVQFE